MCSPRPPPCPAPQGPIMASYNRRGPLRVLPLPQPCGVCLARSRSGPLDYVCCAECSGFFHKTCLDMAPEHCPTGVLPLPCYNCLLLQLKCVDSDTAREMAARHHEAMSLALAHRATGTMKNHGSHLRALAVFASTYMHMPEHVALPPEPGAAIPVLLLVQWLVHASKILSPATLDNYLSSFSAWHRAKGLPEDTWGHKHPAVKAVLEGVKRKGSRASAAAPARKCPLSVDLLLALVDMLRARAQGATAEQYAEEYRDAAMLCMGFFAFLRASELAALQLEDVTFDAGGQGVRVHIRRSKGDQRGLGHYIDLAAVSGSGVPLRDLLVGYVRLRRSAGARDSDPLFPRRAAGGGLSAQPIAGASQMVSKMLRGHLGALAGLWRQAGHVASARLVEEQLATYASHSLRRGGATRAMAVNVPRELTKRHGRWRSDAVDVYQERTLQDRLRVTLLI